MERDRGGKPYIRTPRFRRASPEGPMAKEFKLPDIGEGVHEGEITKWLPEGGGRNKEGAPLSGGVGGKGTGRAPPPPGAGGGRRPPPPGGAPPGAEAVHRPGGGPGREPPRPRHGGRSPRRQGRSG